MNDELILTAKIYSTFNLGGSKQYELEVIRQFSGYDQQNNFGKEEEEK